jgi:hypothetical protein
MSDAYLSATIVEANREAAECALFIRLDNSYNKTTVIGKASYDLDPLIIFIDVAKLSGEARPLVKTTRRELDFTIQKWEAETGTPKYYFQQGDKITLYPLPDTVFTLLLDGSRRPEVDMEVPEQYHESLASWCLYRYFSSPDSDIANPALAQMHRAEFHKVFGHKRSAQFDTIHRAASENSPMYRHPFQ